MPGGRPSKFTQDIADTICAEIMSGKGMREICSAEEMPGDTTVYRWLTENSAFREQYARAKEVAMDKMAEELLEIADDGQNDWMLRNVGEDQTYVLNGEHVQRSRLRADTRKWLMSKLAPKKYGDRQQVDHGVSDGLAELLGAFDRRTREERS